MSCGVSCVFVGNKSIITRFLTSAESFILLQWKSHLFLTRREICTDQTPFTSKNSYLNTFFWCESKKRYCGFWTHILSRSNGFKFKKVFNDGFDYYKHAVFLFSRHYLMNWSGVDYCDVFISCLDSHSDGTHSLQGTHRWDTDVKLHFSKSDEENLIYILDGLRVNFVKFSFLGELFLQ